MEISPIWLVVIGAFVLALVGFYLIRAGTVLVDTNEVGIVTKKTDPMGRHLAPGSTVALNGEVGVQPDTLPPGEHRGYWPWMYTIQKVPVVSVPPGYVGLVFAKAGSSLEHDRILGLVVECHNFEDAREFFRNGGQRGRQLDILTAGEYRINTELFTVYTVTEDGYAAPSGGSLSDQIVVYSGAAGGKQVKIYGKNTGAHAVEVTVHDLRVYAVEKDMIGIVTVADGKSLQDRNAIPPFVAGHNSFQLPQVFIDNGGCKGRQPEVLSPGAYNLNPWFLKVEQVAMPYVPTGTVGVVSSSGKAPPAAEVDSFVEPNSGYSGIWREPLGYGSHAMNPYIYKITIVPTHEISLEWNDDPKDDINYDLPLKRLKIYSADGFPISFNVTQKFSILPQDAPKMVQRIGSMEAERTDRSLMDNPKGVRWPSIRQLIKRGLQDKVETYLREAVERRAAIAFHDDMSEIKRDATERINEELKRIGVNGIETYILDVTLPEEIREQLAKRTMFEQMTISMRAEMAAEDQNQQLVVAQLETERIRRQYLEQFNLLDLNVKRQALKDIVDLLTVEGYLKEKAIEHWKDISLPNNVIGTSGWMDSLLLTTLSQAHLVAPAAGPRVLPADNQAQQWLLDFVASLEKFSQDEGNVEKLQETLRRIAARDRPRVAGSQNLLDTDR
jgi:uncharacterized membrane protein YqiK